MLEKILKTTITLTFVFSFVGIALANHHPMPVALVQDETGDDHSDGNLHSDDITDDDSGITGDINQRRLDIETKKKELQEAREEKKAEIKEDILTKAKTAAEKGVESTIKKLNKIKEKVVKLKIVNESLKEDLNAKIDERIELLEDEKDKVLDAETADEVRAIMKSVHTEIRNTVDIIKDIVASIHETHLLSIIDRMQSILDDVDVKVENPSKELIELVSGTQALLADAKINTESGEYKEAKRDLKEIHKLLGKVIKKVKENKIHDDEENE